MGRGGKVIKLSTYVEEGQKGNTHEDIPGVDRRKRRGRYGAERINNKRK